MRLRFCALCFVVGGSMLFAPPVRGNRGGGTAVFLCFRRRHAFRRRRLFWFRLCGCFGRRTSGCGCFIGKGRSFAVRGTAVRTVRPARGLFVFRCAGRACGCFWHRRGVRDAGGDAARFRCFRRCGARPAGLVRIRTGYVCGRTGQCIRLRRMLRISAVVFAAGLRCSEHLHPGGRRGANSRGRAARKGERHGERVALYADLQPPPKFCMKDCAMESPRPLPSVVRLASPRTKRWSTSSGAKFIS